MRTTGFLIATLTAAAVMTAGMTACGDHGNTAKGETVVTPSEQTQSVGKANPVQAQVTGEANVKVVTSQKKLVQMTKTESDRDRNHRRQSDRKGDNGLHIHVAVTESRT